MYREVWAQGTSAAVYALCSTAALAGEKGSCVQWGRCRSAPSSFLTVSCAGREAACDESLGEHQGEQHREATAKPEAHALSW